MTVVFVVSTPGKLLVLQLAQLIDRVSLPACRSVRLQVCQLLKIWDVSQYCSARILLYKIKQGHKAQQNRQKTINMGRYL